MGHPLYIYARAKRARPATELAGRTQGPAAEPQGTVVKGKEDETGKGRTGGKGERAERETKGLNLGCYRFGHGV